MKGTERKPDNSVSESDSDYDSNYDSGCDDEQRHRTQALEKVATDWIIVIYESRQPLWIPLASLDKRHGAIIPYAAHPSWPNRCPSLPIVVVHSLGRQVVIINTDAGSWYTTDSPKGSGHDVAGLLNQPEFQAVLA